MIAKGREGGRRKKKAQAAKGHLAQHVDHGYHSLRQGDTMPLDIATLLPAASACLLTPGATHLLCSFWCHSSIHRPFFSGMWLRCMMCRISARVCMRHREGDAR